MQEDQVVGEFSVGSKDGGPAAAAASNAVRLYLRMQWAAVLLHALAFLNLSELSTTAAGWLFIFVALLSYATGYWLIMAAVGLMLGALLCGRWNPLAALRGDSPSRRAAWARAAALVASASMLHVLLYVDHFVYGVFGFHLNSFVLNLLTTPGGAESMDVGASAKLSFALVLSGIVVANALLWLVAHYLSGFLAGRRKARHAAAGRSGGPRRRILKAGLLALLLVLCGLGQAMGYGAARLSGRRDIMRAAQAIPWFMPVSIKSFARRLGWTPPARQPSTSVDDDSLLRYPLGPVEPVARPLNVVWLVGESWRWDQLSLEISPNIWNFARERGVVFTHHYSSGVNTRMGLFGMFYGLHGNYWFPVLDSARPPVMVELLKQAGYAFRFCSSARFTYPEFDRTILADIDSADIIERPGPGKGWQRDAANVDDLLAWLGRRAAGEIRAVADAAGAPPSSLPLASANLPAGGGEKPFMMFMFFESPHAGYHFPPEAVIRPDYDADFNYAADLDDNPDARQRQRIYNRYVNASHHMDMQVGRVLDALRDAGVLDRTIIVITGDHGEEFHEKGRWGHGGSDFHEEQMRVPLVLSIPGVAARRIDQPSSHLDLPATVLAALGVRTDPAVYSLGGNLLDDSPHAEPLAATAWDMAMCRAGEAKIIFPFRSAGLTTCVTADDAAVADEDALISSHAADLVDLVRQMKLFRQ